MPEPKNTQEPQAPGTDGDVLGNAVERTDNAFRGKKDGERLIGKDIPIEEQDAEEEEKY
ncbi:hypothetical protein VSX64_01930 [Aurantimonas sp. C2-6-R+9]|uniref:hypothetical protein n=1 Tax=unclassified Aurantimonas TaxID=2638230 RepID=UPI002E198019|nr:MULTISPECIES: hypothetical protein [unclassified Aurantimonas]MEC5289682.1 hypothetical protein [Aurantimonas sp. C2-3-R2]MEC5379648.1 hypothetical protein [Aurantimonas sp. C2-6-R+9]MEC5410881.1 hypothetical protein [Aurantimonas sp. C2-4-R8]